MLQVLDNLCYKYWIIYATSTGSGVKGNRLIHLSCYPWQVKVRKGVSGQLHILDIPVTEGSNGNQLGYGLSTQVPYLHAIKYQCFVLIA